jgi:hypothetical protein
VFCSNIAIAKEWAINYMKYAEIFDFETTLLARLVRDLGNYFLVLAQKQYDCKTPAAIYLAFNYRCWADTLFIRANDVEKSNPMFFV